MIIGKSPFTGGGEGEGGEGEGRCQGYVPLTLDVMRVAFKVPLAFHTPL